jgi:hypothetical protein
MKSNDQDEESGRDILSKIMPLWKFTNFDSLRMLSLLYIYRLLQSIFLTNNLVHPDGIWQSTEVAYNMVYGGVILPWEWWPEYRLRNTLYPYFISLPLYLLKFFNIDTPYLVRTTPFIV